MGFLEAQPLEFNDFSGGLTDNFLQGGKTQYAKGDNFLISVDHKLEERSGSVIYDTVGYQLAANARVSGLFFGIAESVLFGHANRDIYTQLTGANYGTAWSAIKGVTGNEALSGGDQYSQVTSTEFQRQMYLTSDYGTQPVKVFRDQTNTWKAVTAGVPRIAFTPNYSTDNSIVSAAIVVANAIRTSMVAHFQDQAGIGFGSSQTAQHSLTDKWSLSYFVAQSWSIADTENPGPSPAPTPAAAATDKTSLLALCAALALAYEHHRNDLAGNSPTDATQSAGGRIYHQQQIYIQPSADGSSGTIPTGLGINSKLLLSGVVTTGAKAAAFLDELYQKWFWHQLSPFSHSPTNDYTVMSRYLCTSGKVGTIYRDNFTLQVTPNYTDFIAFATWCKSAYNKHALGTDATSGNMHGQLAYGITIPDPTDFDSAALNLFWARYLYGSTHVYDANIATHTRVTFDTTANSTALANVKTTSSAAALTLPVGSWVIMVSDTWNDVQAHNKRAARVISSGSGTAVMSKVATATASAQIGQYSTSWWHGAYVNQGLTTSASDTTAALAQTGEFLANPSTIGTDLTSWLTLGGEFILSLGVHEANGGSSITVDSTHKQPQSISNDLSGTSAVNGNPFFVPVAATYTWAATYKYVYTVEPNGIFYEVEGAPVFSSSTQVCPSYPINTILPSYNANYFVSTVIATQNSSATLASIPSLINTSTTNYDTAVSVVPQPVDSTASGYYSNLTIELYRTTDGGTTFFSLDHLVNSTSTTTQNYLDVTNESNPAPGTTALSDQTVLYTSGGVLANDQPPVAKYVHSFGNIVYYGAITDTGQFFPQRIRQALQGEPDSAPADNFDDLEDELTGLGSTRTNLIGICKNSVYRVSGFFTSTGQGSMTHEKISDSIGGLNSKSIVQTEIGLFFAGTDGFYYTDGYQLIKISLELDKTYQACTCSQNQKNRIYGCYDKLQRRIVWAMQSNSSAADNDVLFIFYLNYGVKPSGVFTKALTTVSWQPSSVAFFKGNLILGDSRGYMFKWNSDTKTDPKIDTTTVPSNWGTAYIPYNYASCALDYGTTFKRKWITKIHAIGKNVGNVALQVNSVNDNNATGNGIKALAPIQYLGNPTWGDARVVWGTASYTWKYDGAMDVWRSMPAGSLRSDFKQIQYTPGSFVIYRSDDFPLFAFATVRKSGLTATLQTPSGYSSLLWPLDVVDYYVSFDTDKYATKYLVTSLDVTKKILTFTDPSGTVVDNSGAKWQISGIKKEQRVCITAFDVHFAFLGDKNAAYPGDSQPGGYGSNSS